MVSADYRKEAREKLSGKWGKAVCIFLVFAIIVWIFNFLDNKTTGALKSLISILQTIVTVPLSFGLVISFLGLFKDETVEVLDFCKTGFYGVEYRNTKDITGNWIKQPFYKTKNENRNLGHGNESVLMMIEILPSIINNRMVIEAVSRHMGFSDLSDSETFNYSNFLQNPLVVLLQTADQTAAQWFMM